MENRRQTNGGKPPLDEKLRLHLGDKLKRLFAETAETPVPDRFSALLDQLQQVGVEGVRAGERPQAAPIERGTSEIGASGISTSEISK